MTDTNKKQVAILVEQKFEDSEFQIPYKALKQAGSQVTVLGSRMNEKYQGKQGQVSIKPDGTLHFIIHTFEFLLQNQPKKRQVFY